MVNIISSFYICNLKNDKRNEELVDTLQNNINSPLVNQIHLFVDDENALDKLKENFSDYLNSKIIIISVGYRPLYGDLFKYAIEKLPGKLCMITNSDIYLRNCTNIRILNMLVATSTCYSLSRHESNGTQPQVDNYYGSHDAFIFFSSNIKPEIVDGLNFYQNNWGSEGRVMGELIKTGIKVFNPCKQIIIVHMHESNIREENRQWIGDHTYGNMVEFINSASYCPPVTLNTYF